MEELLIPWFFLVASTPIVVAVMRASKTTAFVIALSIFCVCLFVLDDFHTWFWESLGWKVDHFNGDVYSAAHFISTGDIGGGKLKIAPYVPFLGWAGALAISFLSESKNPDSSPYVMFLKDDRIVFGSGSLSINGTHLKIAFISIVFFVVPFLLIKYIGHNTSHDVPLASHASGESPDTAGTLSDTSHNVKDDLRDPADSSSPHEMRSSSVDVFHLANLLRFLIGDQSYREIQSYWGYGIIAHLKTERCADQALLADGYQYIMTEDVPATRIKDPNQAWMFIQDRAITMQGCWKQLDDSFARFKVVRKKDNLVVEQQIGIDEDEWVLVKNNDPYITLQDLPLKDKTNPTVYPWVGQWSDSQRHCADGIGVSAFPSDDNGGLTEGACTLKKITKTGEWYGLRGKCAGEAGESEYSYSLRVFNNTLISKKGTDVRSYVKCGSGTEKPEYIVVQPSDHQQKTIEQPVIPPITNNIPQQKSGLEAQYETPKTFSIDQHINNLRSRYKGYSIYQCGDNNFGITDLVFVLVNSGSLMSQSINLLVQENEPSTRSAKYEGKKYQWNECAPLLSCASEFVISDDAREASLYNKSSGDGFQTPVTKKSCALKAMP